MTLLDAQYDTSSTKTMGHLLLGDPGAHTYVARNAEGAGSTMSTKNAQGMDAATQTKLPEKDERKRQPGEGEWAQTVGTFKPAKSQEGKGLGMMPEIKNLTSKRRAPGFCYIH
ncbi:hypothetical protein PtrV1_14042 [Pyrenophora tritici-repentis]|nr:hypothetical protein PtrV1_14042 [Pyrenophora tritici-repentis]